MTDDEEAEAPSFSEDERVPANLKNKSVYMIKKRADIIILSDNYKKDLLFGEVSVTLLGQMTDVLEKVLLPVLSNKKNNQKWPHFISQDVNRHVENLKSKVSVVKGQVIGRTVLPIPTITDRIRDVQEDCIKQDHYDGTVVHSIESMVISWTHQIRDVLKEDSAQPLLQGLNPGPRTELDFWKARLENMLSIYEQLQSPVVRKIAKILETSESSYYPTFKETFKEAFACHRDRLSSFVPDGMEFKPWDFHSQMVFARFHRFLARLLEVEDLFVNILEFQKLEKLEFGGIKGKVLSEQVSMMNDEFLECCKVFKDSSYDPLDYNSQLVAVFGCFLERPVVKEIFSPNYRVLLQMFNLELDRCKQLYDTHVQMEKGVKVVNKNMPATSGSLQWAKELKERIQTPWSNFKFIHHPSVEGAEVGVVYQKYLEMLTLLDEYEEQVYSGWTCGVDEVCQFNLDQPLIKRESHSGLLFVNFDPKLVGVLREVKYLHMLNVTSIPEAALTISEQRDMLVKYIGNLELLVKWYNKVKQTVLEVEYPLIRAELRAIDEQLQAAEETLTWREQSCWEYVINMKDTVHDLERRVQRAKDNMETIQVMMSSWSEHALFSRKENKTDTLLSLEDKNDRVAKRYKVIQESGERIHKLIEENLSLFSVDPSSDSWKAYVEYIDEMVVDGFFRAITCSLEFFIENTQSVFKMSPLFEAQMILSAPEITFKPSLDKEAGGGFYDLVEELLSAIYKMSAQMRRVAGHMGMENYQHDMDDMLDLLDMRQEIMDRVSDVIKKAIQYKSSFDPYAYLWVDDRAEFMKQFLLFGHVLTTEEIETQGDKMFPECPPSIEQFRDQEFEYDYHVFKEKILDLDRRLATILYLAFKDCSGLESAFKLVAVFGCFLERPVVKEIFSPNYRVLLQMFNLELDRCKQLYDTHVQMEKGVKVVNKNMPATSGSLQWAKELKERIQTPWSNFKFIHHPSVEGAEVGVVYQKYLEMLTLLDEYEEQVYSGWTCGVDEVCQFNLDQPLIKRESHSGLLFVNFDPKLVGVLREVKYLHMLNVTSIPEAALTISEQRDMLVKYIGNLELLVKWYNKVKQTVLEVEYPLIRAELRAIDEQLRAAEETLTWREQSCWEYVINMKDTVHDLERRVQRAKDNMETIQVMMSSWSEHALFSRKENKTDTLLSLEDKNDRVAKRYKVIQESGERIHKLIEENLSLFSVDPSSDSWKAYVEYIDEMVVDGFFRAITCSLEFFIENTQSVFKMSPLFEAQMILSAPEITFKPSLDKEAGGGFYDLVEELLSAIYKMSAQMRRVAGHMGMENYQENLSLFSADPSSDSWKAYVEYIDEMVVDGFFRAITCSLEFFIENTQSVFKMSPLFEAQMILSAPEITFKPSLDKEAGGGFYDLVEELLSAIYKMSAQMRRVAGHMGMENYQYKSSFDPYAYLWVDDRAEFMKQFLLFGHVLTTEEIETQGDKMFPECPPSIEQFRDQIEVYEKLYTQISKFEDTKVFESWFRVDIKSFKISLLNTIKKWSWMFKEHLMTYVTDSLNELEEFMKVTDKALQKPVSKGDYKGLVEIMEFLLAVRDQQAVTDDLFEPLKETIALLEGCGQQMPDQVYTQLEAHREIKLLEEQMIEMQESSNLFEVTFPDYRQLKQCRREIIILKGLWDIIIYVQSSIEDWTKTQWRQINVEQMDVELRRFAKEIRMLDKEVRGWDAYTGLDSTVKNLVTSLRAVTELQNSAIRERHWHQLMSSTGVKFTMNDDTTLTDLLALQLHRVEDEVRNIVDKAVKEMGIEKVLTEINQTWSTMEFSYEEHYRTRAPLLKSDEELIETLEDNQVQLQAILQSKYVEYFIEQVSSLQKKLTVADSVIFIWMEVQRTWSHLESIFIGSEDIRKQLPQDAKRFDGIDADFKELMFESAKTKNVIEATNKPNLFERLEDLQKRLSLCEKALAEYLETKRLAFPRFYFVSSADLLDILSKGTQPKEVETWLSRLEETMCKTVRHHITEAVGAYEEKPREQWLFDYPAQVALTSSQVWWTTDVGIAFERLEEGFETALKDYNKKQHVGEAVGAYEEKPREQWLFDYPAQVALTSSQVWWTTDVGIAFERLEEGFETALKDYNKKQISQLNILINMLLGELTPGDRQKIMTICTIDVHARDVVAKLIAQKVTNSQAFPWLSQLRHRWDEDRKHCFANICDAQFQYSYEYLGNTPRLVITPLTDRCYITLTQSLHLTMSGAPAGPAGTGKTETTKDLGRALGVMVYVFNCSEQMDYKSIGNIYKGLAQTGAWGCFDEFNRISVEVLSVVAVQVKTIQDAIRNKRTRPCAMVVPDIELICEIMLVAEGFLEARLLARKFITLYTLCRELLSKQDHYDWGLRAVKSVLVVAGSLKRGDKSRPEDQVLMRALRDFNLPKIVTDDVPIFMGLIGDLFPALNVPRKRDMEFEQMVRQSTLDLCLQPEESFILKVVQLEELLAVRHSVFVVGNAGTGKSEILKTLNKTYMNLKRKPVWNDLNPKAVITDELFGVIHPATREWKDGNIVYDRTAVYKLCSKTVSVFAGLLSCLMREQANISHHGPKWIVLDGDIDPMWIESLNTVMDDNKVLTLASNERIPLTPTMRLVFEISHLRTATPATVSRAGILYVNPQDLGWNPYVASWIDTRSQQSEKANLTILFDKYVPPCLELLRSTVKTITPIPENSMVQTLCSLLDCLLTPENVLPDSPRELYEIYFSFACIWAFGGAVYQDQVLTLASNERIPLTPTMRLVFEISHLRTATPATVSRAGILYVNPQDLGWNPYVASWIDTRSQQSEKANLTILFDKYVPPCLELLRSTVKTITPIPENSMVQTLCSLLDCLLTPENVLPDSPRELYEIYFSFACIWAFGGAVYQDQLIDYRAEFSQWWTKEMKTVKFPSQGTVFDYYLDPQTRKFLHWNDKVPAFVMEPEASLQAVLVHTSETTRLRYFMDLLLERGKPVMLAGNAGVGKTALVGDRMGGLSEEYMVSNVPLNYYTTSAVLQKVLEKPLEKKAGRNYGPPGNKKLVYFIDDLNMPAVDAYGTVQAHTLIRQHMDYKHWYDRQKLTLKEIHNCQYVACMNPTAGSFTINSRLQRHFTVFAVNFPSADALEAIYSQILNFHFQQFAFSPAVVRTGSTVVQAAIWLHQKMVQNFLPTAIKFHYIFNLRDLSNIFQGVGDHILLQRPLIYCHFANGVGDPRYMPVKEWETLKRILVETLNSYNELNAAMNLVLFEDAMQHVCRISRILEASRGYALLVGVGGSGKQSLTRLAAYISSLDVFQVTLRKGYGIQDLRVDLANLYFKTGAKNMPTVFLLTDAQVPDERFLVLINDLLASGEIPDLFSDEEVDGIITGIRNEVRGLGLLDSRENCWKFFIERVRQQLKVVLCFSPVGSTLRIRARKFPAVVNCTAIDWFHEWPREALQSVSRRLIEEIEGIEVVLCFSPVGSTLRIRARKFPAVVNCTAIDWFHEWPQEALQSVSRRLIEEIEGIEPSVQESISLFMAYVHTSVNETSEKYRQNEKRYNYTTPKNFLEQITLYKNLLGRKRQELSQKMERLANGIEKLKTTASQVEELKAKLASQEVELNLKNQDAEALITKIGLQTEKVSHEKTIADAEEQKVAAIQAEVSAKQKDCEDDLSKAEPALVAATAALNTLNKVPIPLTEGLDPIGMLTDDATVAAWNNEGLPSDRMSTENATILTNCERWPLMIDPQQQGIKWIKNKYGSDLKVVCLGQKGYLDTIERAVAGGETVLIENLEETVEPVLDTLLGRNTIKKGRYIRIGDKECKYSSRFRLILHTKLANPHYKPEMQAQSTLINFTVTRDGLEEQLLAEVVSTERPDLEKLKSELTKQQNDFKIELKRLEDELLTRLSAAKGSFLGDTVLVEKLETTKLTAAEIECKVFEAKENEIKINEAREFYRPAAERASVLYFIINDLSKINPMYQFSLKTFNIVFHKAIERAEKCDEVQERVVSLKDCITYSVFLYTSRGLFERDKLTFLSQTAFQILLINKAIDPQELDFLLRFNIELSSKSPVHFLSSQAWSAIKTMSMWDGFRGLDRDIEGSAKRWKKLVESECPEREKFPQEWKNKSSLQKLIMLRALRPDRMTYATMSMWDGFRGLDRDIEGSAKRWKKLVESECPEREKFPQEWKNKSSLQKLIMLRALRPDRMTYAVRNYVEENMGSKYVEGARMEFAKSYEESSPATPVFFILSAGVNPLKDVESLGKKLGFTIDLGKLHNVSLGQGQEVVAEKALEKASREGHWVILQNVHLVAKWLGTLQKLLEKYSEGSHPDYRVFISAEPAATPDEHSIPQVILENSIKITNEPPTGMLANLHAALYNFDQDTLEMCAREQEFKSILFCLCYFHACVAERRKFGPQGWNRSYPFNTGDLTISVNVLYNYLEANTKDTLEMCAREQEFRSILFCLCYFHACVAERRKFGPQGWNRSYPFNTGDLTISVNVLYNYLEANTKLEGELFLAPGFVAPPNLDYVGYHKYVDDVLPPESPVLYGLHPNAEIEFLTVISDNLFRTILEMQPRDLPIGEGSVQTAEEKLEGELFLAPGFVAPPNLDYVGYHKYVDDVLPPESPVLYGLHPNAEIEFLTVISDNLFRTILEMQPRDLPIGEGSVQTAEEKVKNVLDDILEKLPEKFNMNEIMLKTSERTPYIVVCFQECERMNLLIHEIRRSLKELDLGLKVTIMQSMARKNEWPLDKMCLTVDVTKKTKDDYGHPPREGAYIHGLYMEGARWDAQCGITEAWLKDLAPAMPVIYVRAIPVDRQETKSMYACPVYKTKTRGPTYVWTFNLKTKEKPARWILAGVALLLSV
ncbi:UNVERIFIED_CONTAM: hypothetical protein FKN15_039512 [Acipenser sinensis]